MVSEHAGEGFWNWDRLSAKGNPHLVRDDNDRGCLQRGDPHQWLGVEEQQGAGDTVWKGFRIALGA